MSDAQAKEIIFGAMASFDLDIDLIDEKFKAGRQDTEYWKEKIREAITPLIEKW